MKIMTVLLTMLILFVITLLAAIAAFGMHIKVAYLVFGVLSTVSITVALSFMTITLFCKAIQKASSKITAKVTVDKE